MQPTGAAKTTVSIIDLSVLVNTALAGITNFLGLTERGAVGVPTLIGSWVQYQQVFGNLLSTSVFPHLCKRALDAGGALLISRAAKYSNPADATTITGTKAVYSVTQGAVSAVAARVVMTLSAVSNSVDGSVVLTANVPGASNVALTAVPFVVDHTASIATNLTSLATAVNGYTSTSGYSATATSTAITIIFPIALGDFGNLITVSQVSNAATVWDAFTYTGTGGLNTTVNTGTLSTAAASIGIWGNNVSLKITNAASNKPHFYDLTFTTANSVLIPEVYTDFPQAANDAKWAARVAAMLQASQMISTFTAGANYVLTSTGGTLSYSTGTDTSALNPVDYLGDVVGQTNLHSFDNIGTATKVCVPEIADSNLDLGIAAWVDKRQDLMGLLHTPIGLQPQTNINYRLGIGTYNHAPVNSWRCMMSTGGLTVLDPLTLVPVNITEVADWAGIIASKDNAFGQWFSFAGYTRGTVNNALGVVINVGSPALASANDNYDTNGINPVIQDGAKNILFWGDSTLWLDHTSLLCKAEVAELLVFLQRSLNAVIPKKTFDPNDVDSWKSIYRNVKVLMTYLQNNRAIWKWTYQGDQNIVDVSQAKVNSTNSIDAGQYTFNLFVAPKVNMKYINIKIIVTNSGVDFSQITGI